MAEHILQDPRLTLAGAGFLGDLEAQDGVHLRWSFDPELGFPPEGFTLWHRPAARKDQRKVSFTSLAQQLGAQPAPAGVTGGVTVHQADGARIAPGRRCGQIGLDLRSSPLVLRFRTSFGVPPAPVRQVTLFGITEGGAVSVRARHVGRVADCAAVGAGPCLRQVFETGVADQLTALAGMEFVLPGRHLRGRRSGGKNLTALLDADRAAALKLLNEVGFQPAASGCKPFQITVEADAIDEIHVSGCKAILVGALWSPIAPDECERGWKLLRGPICLPVEGVPAYQCSLEEGGARDVARRRLPDEGDLPSNAPRRTELEARLLGPDFDELQASLQQALGSGGQFVTRLQSDDPDDGTSWRYDFVREALTAAADPYFARLIGLYWVHQLNDRTARHDYKIEATWPIVDEKRSLCWVIYDRGPEAQPTLPAPTNVTATAHPGAAHLAPGGVLNPFEMDVTVNWRRPSICELADPVRSPIAYLLERTEVDAADSGPYRLVTRRAFQAGDEPEVVPTMIADPEEGAPRFASGYFVDRGPGYGTFHYRVLGRDLFGRTSGPSAPASVLVNDEVAPGPPLNLVAEYVDPDDPDRAGSALLAWANRDATPGAPRRAALAVRWIWPASRQFQFPDLEEFRLYYRPGSLNHILGRVESVTQDAPSEYEVTTDMTPVGPDFPVPQSGVDLGAVRSEGEECSIMTIVTVGGKLVFRVRANPAAPPLVGPCTFRLGRGISPTSTQAGRAPHPAFRTFERPAHWEGFLINATAPPLALRVAADGTVRGPLPDGLTPDDVDVTRVSEAIDGQVHWHYRMALRGITLAPTLERPRAVASFGIGSVDVADNQGRIAPPASIVAIHRTPPTVPAIVYPPTNYATTADYHGTSWFTVKWTGDAGIRYQVYRAGDLDLLDAVSIDLADHRALTADEQRLQLQQLARDPGNIEAFRLVTPMAIPSRGGPMRHRDALPGAVRNRFVYRVRAVDSTGNLAPWPPASSGTCVVVDLPGVPPAPPVWAEAAFPSSGGVALRWVPNAASGLRGYRLYRADDAEAAEDVRSMTPLFTAPQDEGGGSATGVVVTRDATGAVTSVTELPAGDRPRGRLVQHVDMSAESGHPLYYRLVAEDASGNRSPTSERLVVQLPKTEPPTPPEWAQPVLAPGSVALSWVAGEADLQCLVLRRVDGTLWRALSPWAAKGDYAFTDTEVVASIEYEYRVRVRDSVGHMVDGPVLDVTAI
jgi:hypothetical protein